MLLLWKLRKSTKKLIFLEIAADICYKVIITSLFLFQIYPDNFARREISCFMVRCRNYESYGCQWTGPLKSLKVSQFLFLKRNRCTYTITDEYSCLLLLLYIHHSSPERHYSMSATTFDGNYVGRIDSDRFCVYLHIHTI